MDTDWDLVIDIAVEKVAGRSLLNPRRIKDQLRGLVKRPNVVRVSPSGKHYKPTLKQRIIERMTGRSSVK